MFGVKFSETFTRNASVRNSVRGNRTVVTEAREAKAFSRVVAGGAITVQIEASGEHSIEVTAESNIMPMVLTSIEHGTLFIGSDGSYESNDPIVVKVKARKLDALSASGAVAIEARVPDGNKLAVDISGAARAVLKGQVKELSLTASGAANVEAKELLTTNVDIDASGASNLSVYAGTRAKISVSGASSVDVWGNPSDRKDRRSGVGSITYRQ